MIQWMREHPIKCGVALALVLIAGLLVSHDLNNEIAGNIFLASTVIVVAWALFAVSPDDGAHTYYDTHLRGWFVRRSSGEAWTMDFAGGCLVALILCAASGATLHYLCR